MIAFPDIKIRKTIIKCVITCEYEIADVSDIDQVRESLESALDTLRGYGSAEIVYDTDAQTVDVPSQKVKAGRKMPV